MNDLTGFWEDDQSFSHSKHHVVTRVRKTEESGESSHKTPGVGKDETLKAETPMVEKTRRHLPALPAGPKRVLLAAAVLLVFGVLLGTNLPRRNSGEKLLLDIKEDIGEEARLAGAALDATDAAVLGTAETTEGKIKVVSANLVGIWQQNQDKSPQQPTPTPEATPNQSAVKSDALHEMESVALNTEAGDEEATQAAFSASNLEPELRLAGVRIIGEIQNVGGSTVYAANVFVRFYGTTDSTPGVSGVLRTLPGVKSSAPVASKVGEWNQGYKFLPLAPGETGAYDVVVLSPPEFENVTIEMKVDPTVKKSSLITDSLKVKNKKLKPATLQQGNQQINYFTFNGLLVNTGKDEIVNPGIYVWLKNRQDKVIAIATKTLSSDLLLPKQELEVDLFVIPVTSDEMASSEVRSFGEKL